MLLIPGRTSTQGTTLNAGKLLAAYRDEVSTVDMNADDMARLGLSEGDRVRLRSADGDVIVRCRKGKEGSLPPGLMFIPYGPPSSRLMGGDTGGSGMPISKNLEVEVEAVAGDHVGTVDGDSRDDGHE